MNCKEFQEMTAIEKRNYIGSLTHAVMSDPDLFEEGRKIIERAVSSGIFEKVVIDPQEKRGVDKYFTLY
jgi:hypothetical protein